MLAVRTELTRGDYCGMESANVGDIRAVVLPALDGTVVGSGYKASTVRTDVQTVHRAGAGTLNLPHQRTVQSFPVSDLPIRAACQDLNTVRGELRHHKHSVSHENVFPGATSVTKKPGKILTL